jgi:hypothetical protein
VRAIRFQAIAFDNAPEGTLPPELGVLIRYQSASERAFYRALRTLQALQKERKSTERQFVSQNRAAQITAIIDDPCRGEPVRFAESSASPRLCVEAVDSYTELPNTSRNALAA